MTDRIRRAAPGGETWARSHSRCSRWLLTAGPDFARPGPWDTTLVVFGNPTGAESGGPRKPVLEPAAPDG